MIRLTQRIFSITTPGNTHTNSPYFYCRESHPWGESSPAGGGASAGRPLPHHSKCWHYHRNKKHCAGRSQVWNYLSVDGATAHQWLSIILCSDNIDNDHNVCPVAPSSMLKMCQDHRQWHHLRVKLRSLLLHHMEVRKRRRVACEGSRLQQSGGARVFPLSPDLRH